MWGQVGALVGYIGLMLGEVGPFCGCLGFVLWGSWRGEKKRRNGIFSDTMPGAGPAHVRDFGSITKGWYSVTIGSSFLLAENEAAGVP